MSHLVLELRPGETMLVNGAVIRFRNRCRVELVSKARFLFGKQILEDHDGATVPEQLYCAIQTLYVGQPSEADAAQKRVQALLQRIAPDALPDLSDPAAHLSALLDDGELYLALKCLRAAMQPGDSGSQKPGQAGN